jgi:hypothetical protein
MDGEITGWQMTAFLCGGAVAMRLVFAPPQWNAFSYFNSFVSPGPDVKYERLGSGNIVW